MVVVLSRIIQQNMRGARILLGNRNQSRHNAIVIDRSAGKVHRISDVRPEWWAWPILHYVVICAFGAGGDGGIDLRSAATAEGLGAFFKGGTGSSNVVNDQNACPANDCAGNQRKGSAHILFSLRVGQSNLSRARARSTQDRYARQIQPPRNTMRQRTRDMKPPFEHPPPMAGHIGHSLNALSPTRRQNAVREPFDQQRLDIMPASKLVLADQFARSASVRPDSRGPQYSMSQIAADSAAIPRRLIGPDASRTNRTTLGKPLAHRFISTVEAQRRAAPSAATRTPGRESQVEQARSNGTQFLQGPVRNCVRHCLSSQEID